MDAFIAGSSLPSVAVTMMYVGYYFRKKGGPSDIHFEKFALVIPLFYGIFAVIEKKYIKNPLVTGALLGLFLSFMGRFILGLPQKMFGFSSQNEYQVHIIAMILYAMIFKFIVKPIIGN